MNKQSLFDENVLRSQLWDEYLQFSSRPEAPALHARLKAWAGRDRLNERESETAFIQRFFVETWGYSLQGADFESTGYTCRPQFPVKGAGQRGGYGFADLALGHFGTDSGVVAQVLCEFKDIRTSLDSPQPRKGNNRSPVQQCKDYLNLAWGDRGDAPVEPVWGIVTDMNEFRLYTRLPGHSGEYQRFIVSGETSTLDPDLCTDNAIAAFRRFLFWHLFRPDLLLTERSPCTLAEILRNQRIHSKDIEKSFYQEYSHYRKFLYETIVEANPDFQGTRGKLVRLTQRILDRCIFIMFCEDMGRVLSYPPELFRNLLAEYSNSQFYSSEGPAPWDALRELFRAMNAGGPFGQHEIRRFNGGLFEADPQLEGLRIPAKVFCAKGQATDVLKHPLTLLYFSSAYNFGLSSSSGQRTIGLTTLGRIFEQSITELEIMEADADNRVSINRLSKRKTDGVYYTPEWVTCYLVEETVGARLADIRAELGEARLKPLTEEDITAYRAFQQDKRRTAPVAGAHRDFLREYRDRLNRLTIVDPACGSGAFLIQALDYLVAEYRRVVAEEQRIEGQPGLFDQEFIIQSILSHNIYGVDINPESVEITKLALWLHTVTTKAPLCSLDQNIRCGNSLVGTDFDAFYNQKHATLFEDANANVREQINAFDWESNFKGVFYKGGFDCVIGNPPYVKLQNFRRSQPDVTDYLITANRPDGSPVYESTRTGNFDLYLPFIEKGIALLKPEGRMGYIAPNVWLVNQYGQSLRDKIKRDNTLDRWLDFKSFQVFEEAITYTALQFYQAKPAAGVACAFAPDGSIADVDWDRSTDTVPYSELPDEGAWTLLPEEEMRLVKKLQKTSKPLEDCCSGIVVGIQTSADDIYHLQKIGPRRYQTKFGETITIEDRLMRPLVSGQEAKRYQLPTTDTYLIFPYFLSDDKPRLFTEEEMESNFPCGWAYLQGNETTLRARESNAFNDNAWYRFGRNQNIDKQEFPKLMIPRLITRLFCTMDIEGECYLDNVDVGGILTVTPQELPFIAGIFNAPVCNFVWRRTSKPFQNDYRAANKQFIAPLPIPDASEVERQEVGQRAQRLQALHSHLRDLAVMLEDRLMSPQTIPVKPKLKPDWLWADVGDQQSWRQSAEAPSEIKGRELTAWAKAKFEEKLATRLTTLDDKLVPGSQLEVVNTHDTITVRIAGVDAMRLFDKPDTPFIAAQWRHALRTVNVTEAFNGQRLLNHLLDLRTTADATLRDRIVALDGEITALAVDIDTAESEMNTLVYTLYKLLPDEIKLIESTQYK